MAAYVTHFVHAWTELYSNSAPLRTVVAFVHVAGLVGGGGAAIATDRAMLRVTRRDIVMLPEHVTSIRNTHRIVLAGLTAIIGSGVLLFAADVPTYSVSRIFWIKMAMVALLMINGAVLVRIGADTRPADERPRRAMRRTATISLALWFLITLAGSALPNIG